MTGAFAGELALVVGYGISGRAAVDVLVEEGARVRVSEARPDLQLDTGGSPEGRPQVEVFTGGHRPEHLDGVTMVVLSPGVPPHADIVRWAGRRGLPVISELELGARLCRVPVVAVTGTNGKTTTTEMVAAMLRAAGRSARACGNVGFPFSVAARDPGFEALVVECSSFQLAFQTSLHPRVSVLLNVAPDHLDWHGSVREYAGAKARVYAAPSGDDVHVGDRDDALGAEVSSRAPCALRWFGTGTPRSDGDAGVAGGRVLLVVDGLPQDLGVPSTPVRSFALDAAAAAAAAHAMGVPPEAIGEIVRTFSPLPHRGALVAEVDGVRFVDDSKATNPHAALAALDGATRTVLVAGGLAKGVDLSPLAGAAGGLSAVVAIGEAAPELEAVFSGLVPVIRAPSIEEAVRLGLEAAPRPGTVLLAPACASQDMFRDYRERGDRFAAAARALRADPARRTHA